MSTSRYQVPQGVLLGSILGVPGEGTLRGLETVAPILGGTDTLRQLETVRNRCETGLRTDRFWTQKVTNWNRLS
jgi:hypothetical protein